MNQVVPKYVDKIVMQERIQHVPKVVVQEQIVEVPKIQVEEEIVQREVEQVQVVPKYVEKLKIVQRKRNKKTVQPVRTVEIVQENIVERIVRCKKPIIHKIVKQ